MLNFTVGPVQSSQSVRAIGAEQIPYFRTKEFSEIMFENEKLIKKFAYASDEDNVVFITGSGTASMEAAIINTLNEKDKALVVNGGSFGERFVKLCEIHGINFDQIKLDAGKTLDKDILYRYDNKGYTAFIVNVHETSTGVLYDLNMISEFCKKNNLFLIVDAISSFLADPIKFKEQNIDVLITGSQKALACPPGVSVLLLNENAINRIESIPSKCMYLDLKDALNNARRGQTPFTPAVSVLLQINRRLKDIDANGGVEKEIERIADLAADFRKRIKAFPFEIFSNSLSNAVTPLCTKTASAKTIFETLKNEYGIWICPNGGELAEKVFRIGHLGELSEKDNDTLIEAFKDLNKRGLI